MSKVFCVYHIAETDDLSDGYIGITCNLKRRFSSHRNSNCNDTVKNFIRDNNLTYRDVTVLLYASKEYCTEIERKLRPRMNISWNIAKGGGGANNVGENAYNYNPDAHHPCEGGCGKVLTGYKPRRCMPCKMAWFRNNAEKYKPILCIDCGKDRTSELKSTGSRKARCRECFSAYKSKENPSRIAEPYHIYNLSTGDKMVIDSDNIGLLEGSRAASRLASLRTRVVIGDSKNGRESWNGWVIDETPYNRHNFRITKKKFNLSDYGVFDSVSFASKAIGVTQSFIQNRLHRENYPDWYVIEYDVLDEAKRLHGK